MTQNSYYFKQRRFSSTETQKYALAVFSNQHCACVKTEVGRRLVNSACFKFLALLFNIMILWSYIVGKMQVNIQGVEHHLRQMVKTHVLSMTVIFGHELLMSLKTWAREEVPRTSKT